MALEERHVAGKTMRNKQSMPMSAGTLCMAVCHANSPTDGAFPSEQILSTSDSNGLSGIQAPYEINFRDQKVAGSNPVTSTSLNVHNATEHSYVKE